MPLDREGELQLIVEENAGWIEGNTASQSLVREEQLNGKCNAGGDATERRRLIGEGNVAQHGGARGRNGRRRRRFYRRVPNNCKYPPSLDRD